MLLAAGADPAARDRDGRNAADRARDGLATGKARQFELILRLLTDEASDSVFRIGRSVSLSAVLLCCCRHDTDQGAHRGHGGLDDGRHAGVQVTARVAAERQRRRDEPVRLLADEGASRLGGRQPGHQRAAQRSDRGALRGGRHRAEAGSGRDHRGRQRRLPGPAGAAREGSARGDVQTRATLPASASLPARSSLTTPRPPSRTRG